MGKASACHTTGGSHWLTYLWVGPAFPGCTSSCLLNSQALPWLKYNYTNWYLMQWFLKWQCCSEIFPDASLQLRHSWAGRCSLLPIWRRTRGSLHSPSFSSSHCLITPSLDASFCLQTALYWNFCYSFEMSVRLWCFPPARTFANVCRVMFWSVYCGKSHEALYQFV